ncbi:MAG: amidohydrolase family protein, partial [Planctomycetota bacterium]
MRLRNGVTVTLDGTRRVFDRGEVAFKGERITFVGHAKDAPPAGDDEEVIDLGGKVVIPGLCQSHVHLCQTLFRNQADDLALLDWLKQRIWPFEAAHDAASLRASADLGIAELLRGGTTSILDMGTVNHTEAVFEAARAAGLRATIGKCHMDVDAGQPAPLLERTDASLQQAIELCDTWHGAEAGRIRYGFAPRFALSCTEEFFRGIAKAARERGARIHTHASEN